VTEEHNKPIDTDDSPEDTINRGVPTSQYTFDELADIYNQARVDYIVPMPMNGRRMREYVTYYSIDLDASLVAIDKRDSLPNGICMLGVRDDRTWITRLGVIPHRRRRHSGQFLMDALLDYSRKTNKRLIQLEVIKNNEPAHKLFLRLGFEKTRELLIIRRPPSKLDPSLAPHDSYITTKLDEEDLPKYLAKREPGASWVEESISLLNAGSLRGFHLRAPDGEEGWVIFQRTPFQLTHFVLSNNVSDAMIGALIGTVHTAYPLQDTKIENMPENHRTWPIFQKYGYVEAFRRIEMFLYL
jgi:ribosomal protein S18 acetylase RimI-like enzyme